MELGIAPLGSQPNMNLSGYVPAAAYRPGLASQALAAFLGGMAGQVGQQVGGALLTPDYSAQASQDPNLQKAGLAPEKQGMVKRLFSPYTKKDMQAAQRDAADINSANTRVILAERAEARAGDRDKFDRKLAQEGLDLQKRASSRADEAATTARFQNQNEAFRSFMRDDAANKRAGEDLKIRDRGVRLAEAESARQTLVAERQMLVAEQQTRAMVAPQVRAFAKNEADALALDKALTMLPFKQEYLGNQKLMIQDAIMLKDQLARQALESTSPVSAVNEPSLLKWLGSALDFSDQGAPY